MSTKTYAEPQQICCMATLDNCKTCRAKDNCLMLREQLAFYKRLGVSQIEDDIDK